MSNPEIRPASPGSPPRSRLAVVDAARGLAVLAMVAYHACWDTTFFGMTDFDLFHSPWWLAARTAILVSFLVLVGVGLVLADRRGLVLDAFLKRLAILIAAAAAITLASVGFSPEAPIWFGALHHIAVASVIGLPFLRLPVAVSFLAAVVAAAAPAVLAHPWFDAPGLQWLGLMTDDPTSTDYVPILPWVAAVLVGIAAARVVVPRPSGPLFAAREPSEAAAVDHGPALSFGVGAPRVLVWTGRHSLLIYLLHQPILLGALFLVVNATGWGMPGAMFQPSEPQPLPAQERSFLGNCQRACEKTGGTMPLCTGYCRCMVNGLQAERLWQPYHDGTLSSAGVDRMNGLIRDCVAAQVPDRPPPP